MLLCSAQLWCFNCVTINSCISMSLLLQKLYVLFHQWKSCEVTLVNYRPNKTRLFHIQSSLWKVLETCKLILFLVNYKFTKYKDVRRISKCVLHEFATPIDLIFIYWTYKSFTEGVNHNRHYLLLVTFQECYW